MDLYVEKQCVDQMKEGELSKFMMLFEANFAATYRYVSRRVEDRFDIERIVKLTFLDGLGQIQNTPTDTSYLTWLYSLAKPRVWAHLNKSGFGKNQFRGEGELAEKMEKVLGKMSLEEREILRLKFFEELADGDVMTVLGLEEGTIGAEISRVLKRAHFLLFGESNSAQGVYFGELSGFLERARDAELIEVPEAFKLSLRAEISSKIDRRDFAVEVEEVVEERIEKPPVEIKDGNIVGSDDPAKVFVEAARKMREEEQAEDLSAEREFERKEKILDLFDRFKHLIVAVPLVLFVVVVGVVYWNLVGFDRDRGFVAACGEVKVDYDGDFADNERRSVDSEIVKRVCGKFEVNALHVEMREDGFVEVKVDVPGQFLEYEWRVRDEDWRIKKYARNIDRDGKSGKV
ncbi:hypothetical protein JKY72_06145 [Candidatus Gracilibacteria bacterium]|nr:hypothetical protein [Candidatus Gracilibacteria bacterium]